MRTPRRNAVPADRPRHSATAAGPAGSHRWFPGGAGVLLLESAESRRGGRTVRGANGAFCLSGDLTFSRAHPALSPSPLALPSPCFLASLLRPRLKLLSPSSAPLSPGPPCCRPGPASERLLPRARPLSAVSSALLILIRLIRAPRVRPGRPKTGVRLRRTWRVTGNTGLLYEV